MTPSQKTVFDAIPSGRWFTVADVQRHVAKNARVVWPQFRLSMLLGFIAQRGALERATVDGRTPIYRRAVGAA